MKGLFFVILDRLLLHKNNDVYTLPVCVLQWNHESLKYYFSVDMAEVDLSDAEKIFIKHGVQVMFILLFKTTLRQYLLSQLNLCSNPIRFRGYFSVLHTCMSISYRHTYGKHFHMCYLVNYVKKINEVMLYQTFTYILGQLSRRWKGM